MSDARASGQAFAPAARGGRLWAPAALLAATAIAAVAHLTALGYPAFRLDDAYIVLHNVDALWHGDRNFPGAPPLLASTSLLHSLAVAALSLAAPPEYALWGLAWLAVAALALGVLRLARDLGLADWGGVALAVCAVTAGQVFRVLLNGLETGWMMAAIVWTAVLARRERPSRALPVLCAALPFLRPELAVLSLIVMGDHLLACARTGGARAALASLGQFAAPAAALLALQVALSGSVVPATGAAKLYFFTLEPLDDGEALMIAAAWGIVLASTLGPVLIGVALPAGKAGRLTTAFALIALAVLMFRYTGIFNQNYQRYLYFLVPVAVINLAGLMASRAVAARALAAAVIAAALVFNLAALWRDAGDRVAEVRAKRAQLAAGADWIRAHLDPDRLLLVHDIGYLAFATDQLMFDVVGLKSPRAAEINRDFAYGGGEAGRGRALARIASETGACDILVSSGSNRNGAMTAPLRAQGWSVTESPRGSPPFLELYALTTPDGRPCSGRAAR